MNIFIGKKRRRWPKYNKAEMEQFMCEKSLGGTYLFETYRYKMSTFIGI